LKVHKLMMGGLVDEAGVFRSKSVGVVDGAGNVIHMAPKAEQVPTLVKALFKWLNESGAHPLVKSCVFHYEFEFIHPFADGNGRTGRYWQTAILGKWREAFYAAPIENIVWENQSGYYLAIRRASLLGNAEPFIDFMLERILETIKTKGDAQKKNVGVNVGVKLSARERDLIELLRLDGTLTAVRIAETYSISTRQAERLLNSLKKKGFIAREGSDKAGMWVVKERSC
ncbi:MAG: Fic family protein, partial [Kiritimatiellae bacterium]|nr:Fic family protein [Kiritimatiellia bacterium]